MLARALKTIPLGSQTFSKSHTNYPLGVSPLFVARGKGAHVWDADGNEYVDMVNALAAVTLGYDDPDVAAAVKAQIEDGVIFSLPHPLEIECAETIVRLVPSAEMVRFGKNGSDATAGAIRVARAFTGRDRVAACGYHGWQDWYIGSTARNKGVPKAVRDLTHSFPYNDAGALDALLKSRPGEFAAVILEPMNATEPKPGYLAEVKAVAHRHGALLVFDETITGFRYANGGAQQLFGVLPDLTTLGKGMANGYPLSAVAGRADVMKEMEEVFFSFTMGGETLSLAAAVATMRKLEREPVIDRMATTGRAVLDGLSALIRRHGVGHFMSLSGHPSWSFVNIVDANGVSLWETKTLWRQEMFARGILIGTTHNVSYAHTREDVARLLAAYDEVLPMLKEAVDHGAMRQMLKCKPQEPLFRVR
jgi:glutamate-1-semialdehyde 2,1-aminomutase